MIQVNERVEWIASRLAAPGPGKDNRLLGTVLRTQSEERFSVKIRWDNGRITCERPKNIKVIASPEPALVLA